ncbi:hypothetical protein H4R35_001791 [Dimargaris xerosporica]|nr:hypothetical protein H4R35_001791 [Dimargaris xerosporica]
MHGAGDVENDGGFVFRRARPRKLAKLASETSPATTTKKPVSPITQHGRTPKKPLASLELPPVKPISATTTTPDRLPSARKASIKAVVKQPHLPSPASTATTGQSVDERTSTHHDKEVPLRSDETPLIGRNHRMRNVRRRSSFSMRGKRASTLGTNIADPQDFYKHISPELPEPIRMRQLLTWCLRKSSFALPTKKPSAAELKQVMKELMGHVYKAMVNQNIATSWYHRPSDVASFAPEEANRQRERPQPHPSNVANSKRKLVLTRTLERLKAENQAWNAQLQRYTQLAETPGVDDKNHSDTNPVSDAWIESAPLNKLERRMWQLCQQLKETRLDANDMTPQTVSPPPFVASNGNASMPTASLSTSLSLSTLQSFAMNAEPIVDQLAQCAYLAKMLNANLTMYLDTTTARVIRSLTHRMQGTSNLLTSPTRTQPLSEGAPEEQQATAILATNVQRIDDTHTDSVERATVTTFHRFASIDPQDVLRGLSRLLPRSSE